MVKLNVLKFAQKDCLNLLFNVESWKLYDDDKPHEGHRHSSVIQSCLLNISGYINVYFHFLSYSN